MASQTKSIGFNKMEEDNKEDKNNFKVTLASHIFQVRILYLFLWRGWKNGYQFRLGTEIKAVEKFDDLIFYHRKKDEEIFRVCLLQAKHSISDKAKMRYEDFVTTREKGNCNLKKYFTSFRKIKQTLSDANPDEFILCCNIPFKELMLKKYGSDNDTDAIKFEEVMENQVEENEKIIFHGFKKYKLTQMNSELNEMFHEATDLSILSQELAKCVIESEIKRTNLIELDMDNFWFSLYYDALVNEKIIEEKKEIVRFQKNFIHMMAKPVDREIDCKKPNKNTHIKAIIYEFINIFAAAFKSEPSLTSGDLDSVRFSDKFVEILKRSERFKPERFQGNKDRHSILTKLSKIMLDNILKNESAESYDGDEIIFLKEIMEISKPNIFSSNFISGTNINARVQNFRKMFIKHYRKCYSESSSRGLLPEFSELSLVECLTNKTITYKPACKQMNVFVKEILQSMGQNYELNLASYSNLEELIDELFEYTSNDNDAIKFKDNFLNKENANSLSSDGKLFKETLKTKLLTKQFNNIKKYEIHFVGYSDDPLSISENRASYDFKKFARKLMSAMKVSENESDNKILFHFQDSKNMEKINTLNKDVFAFSENDTAIFSDDFIANQKLGENSQKFRQQFQDVLLENAFAKLKGYKIKLKKCPPWRNFDGMKKLAQSVVNAKTSKLECDSEANEVLRSLSRKVFVNTAKENTIKLSQSFIECKTMSKSAQLFKDLLAEEMKGENFENLKNGEFEAPNFPFCCDILIESGNIEKEIEEFCQKLFIVTTPREDHFNKIIAEELGEEFNIVNANIVSDTLFRQLLNWIKTDEKEFLERKDANTFFNEVKNTLVTLMTAGCNSLYCEKLKSYNIMFKQPFLDKFIIALKLFIDSNQKQILHLITDEPLLTAIKLGQALSHYKKDAYIFNTMSSLLLMEKCSKNQKEVNFVSSAFSQNNDLMVIVEDEISECFQFCIKIGQILQQNSVKKLIIVSNQSSTFKNKMKNYFECHQKEDEYFSLSSTIIDEGNIKNIQLDEKFFKKQVIFQGNNVELNKLVTEENFLEMVNYDVLQKLITGEQVIVSKNQMINEEYFTNYYESRNITVWAVNDNLFKEIEKLKNQIFVIEGQNVVTVEGYLADNNVKAFQIRTAQNASPCKFFIVESANAKQQFETMCKKFSNSCIHWLKHSNNELYWFHSYIPLVASISSLKPYLKNICLKENDFIEHIAKSPIVLITDPAGMGKSTTLTSVTHLMSKYFTWTVRIDLNLYTEILLKLTEDPHFSQSKEINFNFDTFKDDHAKLILTAFSTIKMREKRSLTFENRMFDHFFKNGRMIIMFDGFDEICPNYKDKVLDLIMKLKAFCNNQIWITSRLNFKSLLEEKLQTLSYSLEAIVDEDQANLLFSIWKNKWEKINALNEEGFDYMRHYSKNLIEELNKNFMLNDKNTVARPLQLKMIAQNFQENIKPSSYEDEWQGCFDYITSNRKNVILNSKDEKFQRHYPKPNFSVKLNDFTKFYSEYFDNKVIDYWLAEKGRMDLSNVIVGVEKDRILKRQRHIHSILAIKKLVDFNFLNEEEETEVKKWVKNFRDGNENVGIIDVISESGEILFNHDTYAEYLAFCYLKEKLIKRKNLKNVFKAVDSILKRDASVFQSCFKLFLKEKQYYRKHIFSIGLQKTTILNYVTHAGLLHCIENCINSKTIFNVDKNGKSILHYATLGKNQPTILYLLLYVYGILTFEKRYSHNPSFYLMVFVNLKDNSDKKAVDYCEDDKHISRILKAITAACQVDLNIMFRFGNLDSHNTIFVPTLLMLVDLSILKDIFTDLESFVLQILTCTNTTTFTFYIPSNEGYKNGNIFEVFQRLWSSEMFSKKRKYEISKAIWRNAVENNYTFHSFIFSSNLAHGVDIILNPEEIKQSSSKKNMQLTLDTTATFSKNPAFFRMMQKTNLRCNPCIENLESMNKAVIQSGLFKILEKYQNLFGFSVNARNIQNAEDFLVELHNTLQK